MYLAVLNEKQKKLFLELAYDLVFIDGKYSTEEQNMMKEYCREMNLDFSVCNLHREINNILNELVVECTAYEKRIIVFELIGLALVDNRYDKKEKELIRLVMDRFDIVEEFEKKCEDMLAEYLILQKRMNDIVCGL